MSLLQTPKETTQFAAGKELFKKELPSGICLITHSGVEKFEDINDAVVLLFSPYPLKKSTSSQPLRKSIH